MRLGWKKVGGWGIEAGMEKVAVCGCSRRRNICGSERPGTSSVVSGGGLERVGEGEAGPGISAVAAIHDLPPPGLLAFEELGGILATRPSPRTRGPSSCSLDLCASSPRPPLLLCPGHDPSSPQRSCHLCPPLLLHPGHNLSSLQRCCHVYPLSPPPPPP